MTERSKVPLGTLPSGVPGLDTVLGEGLPEYSFNVIAGGPGTGKTTLVQQIVFALASPERPALYFTILGEPPLKMLRYQQQFDFFDPAKLDTAVRFVNLSQDLLESDLDLVLERIASEVQQASPALVVVDSFRSVVRAAVSARAAEIELQSFVQRLSLLLTGWQATTFLVGEYREGELENNPVFTVADGIIWLTQSVDRNSTVRKLRVVKMRGLAPLPGLHTFRITGEGVQVFPRILGVTEELPRPPRPSRRLSSGAPGLDELLGGGIPAGDAVLVAGPSGSGKTVLSVQFISEGVRNGEPGIIAVFEEHPGRYLERARALGLDLEAMIQQRRLKIIYLRLLDLSVDQTLREIQDSISELGAERLVIDSLSGFELALAPSFRDEFRESLYRMVRALTDMHVTVLMTAEITEWNSGPRFSSHAIDFLVDDIILLRYVELDSRLRTVLTVPKMRGSEHSRDLRACEITDHGLVVGEVLHGYRAIMTGSPKPVVRNQGARRAGRSTPA